MVTKQQLNAERARVRNELLAAQSQSIRGRDGAWTPAQVLEHILLTEQSVITVLTRLLQKARESGPRQAGGRWPLREGFLSDLGSEMMGVPAFQGTNPESSMTADEMQATAAANDREIQELMQRADTIDLSSASFPHPIVGRMSFYEWLMFLVTHERLHVEHLRRDVR